MLVVMAGLPGTGKSTVARALVARTGALLLDKDELRPELLGRRESYSDADNDSVFAEMLSRAAEALAADPGRWVILDGRTFARRRQVDALLADCARLRLEPTIVECRCRRETALARIAAQQGDHPAPDRDRALYQRLEREAQPIPEAAFVVDTDQENAEAAAERISSRAG